MRNAYFIAFNRYIIQKNTTNYSKSQQTTEAEAGHFLYFDCKELVLIFAVGNSQAMVPQEKSNHCLRLSRNDFIHYIPCLKEE